MLSFPERCFAMAEEVPSGTSRTVTHVPGTAGASPEVVAQTIESVAWMTQLATVVIHTQTLPSGHLPPLPCNTSAIAVDKRSN